MPEKYITRKEDRGSINVSEDVIINIVIKAIKEVEGVSGLANTAGAELAELVGLKTIPKGVKVSLADDIIVVDAIITVQYGSNILKIAENAQNYVRSAIESATGFMNSVVNIHVSGISFEKNG